MKHTTVKWNDFPTFMASEIKEKEYDCPVWTVNNSLDNNTLQIAVVPFSSTATRTIMCAESSGDYFTAFSADRLEETVKNNIYEWLCLVFAGYPNKDFNFIIGEQNYLCLSNRCQFDIDVDGGRKEYEVWKIPYDCNKNIIDEEDMLDNFRFESEAEEFFDDLIKQAKTKKIFTVSFSATVKFFKFELREYYYTDDGEFSDYKVIDESETFEYRPDLYTKYAIYAYPIDKNDNIMNNIERVCLGEFIGFDGADLVFKKLSLPTWNDNPFKNSSFATRFTIESIEFDENDIKETTDIIKSIIIKN